MSKELLRTRIGNTVTVVLPVLTRGDAVSLVGRDITIMLVDPNDTKTPVSFTIGGVDNNIATFVVEGTSQTATGTYRAEVYENYRGTAMAVYDCDIFVLVARTEYENDGNEGVSSETTTLDPINIAWVGRDGYTPYIQDGYWYINGTSTNVKAAGENGDTPYIENGYWYIGGISTGIKADYTNEEAQRAASEQVRVVAEAARVQAEAARTLAENSRLTEESGRSAAEEVRILAERDRQSEEAMRQTNEEIRTDNEEARVEAELGRAASEASRAQVEATRVANETARTTAEATRAANEQTRVAEETDRAAAETARIAAETARESAEDGRTSAEATRVSNEQTRVSNESTRQSNESARQSAESARQAAYVAAENARDAAFEAKEATRDAANQAALNCADELAALGPEIYQETTTPVETTKIHSLYFTVTNKVWTAADAYFLEYYAATEDCTIRVNVRSLINGVSGGIFITDSISNLESGYVPTTIVNGESLTNGESLSVDVALEAGKVLVLSSHNGNTQSFALVTRQSKIMSLDNALNSSFTSNILICSKLFDKFGNEATDSNISAENGAYVSVEYGTQYTAANLAISDYVLVEGLTKIIYKGYSVYTSVAAIVGFYTAQKTYISGVSQSVTPSSPVEIQVPSNAVYARFSSQRDTSLHGIDSFAVYYTATHAISDYLRRNEEYNVRIKVLENNQSIVTKLTDKYADGMRKSTLLDPIKETPGLAAILADIGFIGDSLTSGYTNYYDTNETLRAYTSYESSWGQRMCALIGAKGINYSIGGLTAKSWWARYITSNTDAWSPNGESVKFATTAHKSYFVALGTNDINTTGIIEGDVSTDIDFEDYTNNADTFVGNYAKILQKIREINEHSPIFCIIYPDGVMRTTFDDSIKAVAALFTGVYVIDLRTRVNSLSLSISNYMLGGHFNTIGYQWLAYVITNEVDYIIRNNMSYFYRHALIGTTVDDGTIGW